MATEFISNSWLMPTNANAESNRVSNYSLDFDSASSQQISLSSAFVASGEFTLSLWVKPDDLVDNNFLGNGGAGSNWLQIKSASQIKIKIASSAAIAFTESGGNNLTASAWNHILIYRDSSNNVGAYVNGQTFGSTGSNTNTLTLSTIGRATSIYFEGKITEVSFYDYSLSATQITELYGTGSAIGNPMAITNGRKPINYYPLSNAAFNSEFLAPNGAEQDYVFDFLAAPTYSRISLGTSDFIGNKSISFWLNKNVNNGSVFAFGNTNYYPNVQSTTLQLNNGSTTILSTGTINLNEWNHYVITGDGTTAKCYVNGVYKSTGIDRDISSAANWIGGQNNGTGMLNGKLSNIQKWDVVLSDGGVSIGDIAGGDISTLYNYGTPYKGTQPQSANLQAWWELDASATFDGSNWSIPDASSNSNTGTSSGMTAANLVQSDLIINAPYDSFSLSFDGSNDEIDCGSISQTNEGDISFSAWCNVTASGSYQAILSSTDTSSKAGINIVIRNDGKIKFERNQDTSNTRNNTGYAVGGFSFGSWHHLCGTFNATSGELKAYINGVLQATSSDTSAGASTTNSLHIGRLSDSSNYPANGKISNVSIYNSALSAAQVKTLYNEHKPFDLNNFEVTPTNWWRLGSVNSSYNSTTSEWTVLDEVGNNNGTGSNLGPAQTALSDGVGATGSGTSSGMSSGTNRTGDAPYSTSNSVSYNMSVTAKSTSVPT